MPEFQPPSADTLPAVLPETRGPAYALFRHYDWSSGKSVLKIDGTYITTEYPTAAQLAVATETYIGGHIYTVTDAVAAELTAAGFSVGADEPIIPLPVTGQYLFEDGTPFLTEAGDLLLLEV